MQYTDTPEQAAEYVRIALPLMSRHNVPANPVNYAIWYEYVRGENSELKKAVDTIIDNALQFSDDMAKELYRRFLAEEDQGALQDMREGLRTLLADLMNKVVETSGNTSKHNKNLDAYTRKLTSNLNVEDLRKLMRNIMDETSSIQSSSSVLQTQLDQTTEKLDTLRKDFERVKKAAVTDPLTGISNRRAFDDALLEASMDAGYYPQGLSLLMLDIDRFKLLNDTYGHLVGDEVLRLVAKTLQRSTKGNDEVARYGGEEFAIILPNTSLKGAVAAAENIRSEFESNSLKRKSTGEYIGAVTVSIGAAHFNNGEDITSLIQRADEALYHAKENGRNQVVSEEDVMKKKTA